MVRGERPNRCTECGRIIREENKSGLCYYDYKIKQRRQREKK